jgi:hypothetical protein
MRLASGRRMCSGVFLFFLTTVAVASAQPPTYQLRDLGFAQRVCNQNKFFNDSAQAVVQAPAPGGVISEPYLIETDGTRTYLGSLFGFGDDALAINSAAQVIGISSTNNSGTRAHPFFWSRTTGMVDITPDATDNDFPAVCAINDRGDVVGGWARGAFIYTGGRRYDFDTQVNIIGRPPSTRFILAGAINNAGQVLMAGVSSDNKDHLFLLTPTTTGNLLVRSDFEDYSPPDLGPPGWISDPIRQIPAKSEMNQPHSGARNGACWATVDQDCGMFQEVVAPNTGSYTLMFFANADRDGGLVGANVNGQAAAASSVAVRGFGNYGTSYSVSFNATAGDTIRVWMYSPASPGYVVIDDVSLTFDATTP